MTDDVLVTDSFQAATEHLRSIGEDPRDWRIVTDDQHLRGRRGSAHTFWLGDHTPTRDTERVTRLRDYLLNGPLRDLGEPS